MPWLLWILLVLVPLSVRAAGNEPVSPLPVDEANQPTVDYFQDQRNFLNQEDAARYRRMFPAAVVSGGYHPAAVAMVSSPVAVEAFDSDGNRVSQQATAIDYTLMGCDPDDTAWVILSSQTPDTLVNFHRVVGTDYFVDCTTVLRPALPSASAWLLEVPIVAGVLGSPRDLASRLIAPGQPHTVSTSTTVDSLAVWHIPPGGRITVAAGMILTMESCPLAGRWQIFVADETTTGRVRGLAVCAAVFPEWFGTVGDGVTDDAVPLQAAINSAGAGTVESHTGARYRLGPTFGSHDAWGINITQSGFTLRGGHYRRFLTDLSTYALAYAVVLVGVPDDDAGAVTEDVTIEDGTFLGENTQHALGSNSPDDFRTAIEVKNTRRTTIRRTRFEQIDSSAIFTQPPGSHDYKHAVDYNTTKNYDLLVAGNRFSAAPHAVASRALIHAVVLSGTDRALVTQNQFTWTDDAVQGITTYRTPLDVETDTWTHATLGPLLRTGRDWVIANNTVYNGSEHPLYLSGMTITVSGNSIWADTPTVATVGPAINLKARNATVTGNTVSGYPQAIGVGTPSSNVTVSGNTIAATGTLGGAIHISSAGLTSYIDARPFLAPYTAMLNIAVTNNTILLPEAATTGITHVGIRVSTDTSDANFPNGQLQNVTLLGNTITNHRYGIQMLNGLARQVRIHGNIFNAKPFTSTAFDLSTTLNTITTLLLDGDYTNAMIYTTFSYNSVYGAEYLFATDNETGTEVHLPWGIQGNNLYFVKRFRSADIRAPVAFNAFVGNTGNFFLDRTTWVTTASDVPLQNGLGNGVDSDSYRKYNIIHNKSTGAVTLVINDTGTGVALGP